MTEHAFLVAHNPEELTRLPYLVRLPIDGGLVLKTREPWPTTSRLYCHVVEDGWPQDAETIEECAVRSCSRRGPAVDLVLTRTSRNRSQFVFTTLKGGRPAIFWQTSKTAKGARPARRIPVGRAHGATDLVIVRDTRERYGYRFAAQQAEVTAAALPAGDYAVLDDDGGILAAVERKSLEDLASSLTSGRLSFQLAKLTELPRALVVVDGRYGDLLRLEHVQPAYVLDLLGREQVRHPSVPIVFAGNRKLAEEYTFRYLGAAWADTPADP